MYISEEQKELEKVDAKFKELLQAAETFQKNTANEITEMQALFYMDEIETVKSPEHQSDGLVIDENILVEADVENEIIFLPNRVTEIGADAFKNSQISKIIFPKGLIKIGEAAFEDATTLSCLDVKDPDRCYPAEAVGLVGAGDEIDQFPIGFSQFPNTLKEIGAAAFRRCGIESYRLGNPGIEYLVFPNTLKRIGDCAFQQCNVKAVYWGGPRTISHFCFYQCKKLEKVIFGNNVKKIERYAFDGCTQLKEISFPKYLTEIMDGGFSFCPSLKELVLPDTLTKVGKYAFHHCKNLSKIVFSQKLKKLSEGVCADCSSIEDVVIPMEVEKICKYAFAGCNSLKKVVISNSETLIEINAFQFCNILTIYAPAGSYAEQYAKENNIKFEAI